MTATVAGVRAYITGSRGFVATWLERHLVERGEPVVIGESDVTDAEAVARDMADAAPDVVYHLAALAHIGESYANPGRVFEVNAVGTLHVLEAARRIDPMPTVLVVSTAEVYGQVTPDVLPLAESAPLRPVSPYAASKVAAEFLGLQAHWAHGLPVVISRSFNHIGPGQAPTFVVPSLAHRIVEAKRTGGTALKVGNLSPRRDFTDVRDVARAYRLLAEKGVPGEVYNVSNGVDVSIEELAHRMLELSGVDLELTVDPELVRPVEVPVLRGDATKLRAATGWAPQVELDDTLRDVLGAIERA